MILFFFFFFFFFTKIRLCSASVEPVNLIVCLLHYFQRRTKYIYLKLCSIVKNVKKNSSHLLLPKGGRGGGILGQILRILFVSIFRYFISWESFNIFSWHFVQFSWYNLDGHYTQTMFPMYIFFLVSIQYFLMKFCTGALGITLIITSTKKFFWHYFPLFRSSFGVF